MTSKEYVMNKYYIATAYPTIIDAVEAAESGTGNSPKSAIMAFIINAGSLRGLKGCFWEHHDAINELVIDEATGMITIKIQDETFRCRVMEVTCLSKREELF